MNMKHILSLTALAAITLASCNNSDDLITAVPTTAPAAEAATPVAFDAYMLRTRATDVITTTDIHTRGFGVFAYQQGTLAFNQYFTQSSDPNFMYDQLVKYNSTVWEYSPLKYWSNNENEKHSFFAYAPYYQADGTTPVLQTSGYPMSPSLTLEGTNNGPAIYYKVPTDISDVIDLCWGEYNNSGHAALDLLKPSVNDKIHFTFRHALSKVTFNSQIWVDEVRGDQPHATESDPTTALDANTKITITSVKLIGSMAKDGTLCLSDGSWNTSYASNSEINLANNFKKGLTACPSAYVLDNNNKEQYLFGTENDYYTVIPYSSFKIRVEYTVETTDANLGGGKLVTPNVYTTDQSYTMIPGKAYHFHLNIGMTSVKLEADVEDWAVTPDYNEIDTPANK